jgi:membrane associated rhomboid family serine protease
MVITRQLYTQPAVTFVGMKNKSSFAALHLPFLFVMLMWIPFLIEYLFNVDLAWLGIYPREWWSLPGIIITPFLHGSIEHLIGNSLPMLVLGGLTYTFYRPIFYKSFFYIIVVGGLFVWAFARPSYHIGASGVIYGLASLLFFSGMFRKSYRLVAVSLLVVFLYGSMIWGLLPLEDHVSFESHIAGGVVGLAIAMYYRKWVFVKQKVYNWSNDEDELHRLEQVYGERYWELPPPEEKKLTIRYIFKPSSADQNP